MTKIIFCEDEARIQKLIRATLRSSLHEIYIASDGVEGLALIEKERPDLIFTDISMPNCDGLQLVDEVKARPELAHIPIIFVTAFAQDFEMEEGYQHGAAGYLIKPFSPADLRMKIEALANALS
jgi:two-component system, OmpR family, alkaline phosphatase synthesis response regulator PhoP